MIFSYFVHFATWGDSSNIWISLQPPLSSPFPRNLVLFMHFTSAFLKFQDLHERNKKLLKTFCFSAYCLILSNSGPGPFLVHSIYLRRHETGWQQGWHDIQHKAYILFIMHSNKAYELQNLLFHSIYWGAWHWSEYKLVLVLIYQCFSSNLWPD